MASYGFLFWSYLSHFKSYFGGVKNKVGLLLISYNISNYLGSHYVIAECIAAKQVCVAQHIWFMTDEFLKLQDRGREFWSNFKEAIFSEENQAFGG